LGYVWPIGESQGFVYGECSADNHYRVDGTLGLSRFRVMGILMVHRNEQNLKNKILKDKKRQDLGSSLDFTSLITVSTSLTFLAIKFTICKINSLRTDILYDSFCYKTIWLVNFEAK